jgi:hypothetical protein
MCVIHEIIKSSHVIQVWVQEKLDWRKHKVVDIMTNTCVSR